MITTNFRDSDLFFMVKSHAPSLDFFCHDQSILEIFTIDTNIRIMISELILVILLVGGDRT